MYWLCCRPLGSTPLANGIYIYIYMPDIFPNIREITELKEPVDSLFQMEFEHRLRKAVAVYLHGYDPGLLYDSFLVQSFCNL